ncbi:MAG: sugar kinase [Bacteroidetes bacterium GWA2_32_17]|nr:MAG: sugar kinase [Bacteroidetes bacterium GWA2_32_17]
MAGIIGIGNALTDVMTRLSNYNVIIELAFPKGSMQLVDKNALQKVLELIKEVPQTITSGGSAANTIHGLSKLGANTAFIGKVGSDKFGVFFSDDLKNSGITPILLNSNNESGCAIAMITPDSERTFAVHLGASVELTANDIKSDYFKGYNYFHIEGYLLQNHELMLKATSEAKKAGLMVSLDLASFNVVEENREFLHDFVKKYVDIVFANEEEAKSYTGKNPEESLHVIAEECKIAIVKIGKEGSLIKSNGNVYKILPIKANSIDTTGAGDLYASGFLYGLMKNLDFNKCGKIGSLLSGTVIETIGAKISNEKWKELIEEVKKIENK